MFRSLSFAGVLMLGSLTAFEVSAQRYDDGRYRPDPVYDDGHYRPGDYQNGSGPAYDYARVVRVDPIIVGSGQGRGERCYERNDGGYVDDGYREDGYWSNDYYGRGYDNGQYRQGSDGGRQLATVIGGLAGAVLGSRVGGGDGRYLGTAVGTIAGGRSMKPAIVPTTGVAMCASVSRAVTAAKASAWMAMTSPTNMPAASTAPGATITRVSVSASGSMSARTEQLRQRGVAYPWTGRFVSTA